MSLPGVNEYVAHARQASVQRIVTQDGLDDGLCSESLSKGHGATLTNGSLSKNRTTSSILAMNSESVALQSSSFDT